MVEADSAKENLADGLRHVTDNSEITLVEAAAGGDLQGFGKLCERYYQPMVAIAYAVLADRHLAEDAAQEAFAKACCNLRQLRNKEKFAPWLACICRNVAKDMAVAKTRQVNAEDLAQLPDEHNQDGTSQTVRDAISKLPASARELIVLRFYNELSYERIGAVLGISRAAVNGRLKRAKRKIARYLQHNGFLEGQL